MVIVDLNQTLIATLMAHLGQGIEHDEGMLRSMVLGSLLNIRKRFKDDGQMILAADHISWRRSVFPYYKANRSKSKEDSPLDWDAVFKTLNLIRDELHEWFPYIVIHEEGAEGDDIIGVLVHEHGQILGGEKIVIVSGDKDFKQLHGYANVYQWDHVNKKRVTCDDPDAFLVEHIVRGDSGDGVPNVRSRGDCFVTKTKQLPITAKILAEMAKAGETHPEYGDNYRRNSQLIDLKNTPDELRERILANYKAQLGKPRKNLLPYFIAKKLKLLAPNAGEF